MSNPKYLRNLNKYLGTFNTLFENESITDINYPELLTPVYNRGEYSVRVPGGPSRLSFFKI